MKCVSYTRSTSSDPYAVQAKDTIRQQNERIARFVKTHGWKLQGKYSDRKHDPDCDAAFQEVKEALLRREYDCIVVDSFYHFGKSIEQAMELTTKTLIPAGIHFAVVEDGFCSEGLCKKEQIEYVWRKRGKNAIMCSRKAETSKEKYFRTYGFQFDETADRVLLDEKSITIVREIFERMAQGELQSSIARDLNRRGVETPKDYYYRNAKNKPAKGSHEWNTNAVNKIIDDVKYLGIFHGNFDLEEVSIDFPPVIDKETFQMVTAMRWKHTTNKEGIQPKVKRYEVSFSGHMFDKESGTALAFHNRGQEIITYSYPKKGKIRYEKNSMSYQQFLEMTKEQLRLEKQRCLQVIELLQSDECSEMKEEKKTAYKQRISQLLQKTNRIEERKMGAYRMYRSGDLEKEQYTVKEKKYKEQLLSLDDKIRELLDQLRRIDSLFSEKNPWVRLFRNYELTDLTDYDVRKYVRKMLVYRFQSVELVPNKADCRAVFPEHWLEVREDGKNE